MKSIAITGTIGSGKSACSQILRESGVDVFDCDKACHTYLEKDGLLYHQVIELLGESILDEEKNIVRGRIAQLIFQNAELKKQYEQMFHVQLKQQLIENIRNSELFVAEVPLLYETGFDALFDEVWLVWCDDESAIERCITYRKMNREDVCARLKTQMSVEEKKSRSDVLIENSGTLCDLKSQVMKLRKERMTDGTVCKE